MIEYPSKRSVAAWAGGQGRQALGPPIPPETLHASSPYLAMATKEDDLQRCLDCACAPAYTGQIQM